MLEIEMNEAIKKFVKTFRVVRRRHLELFFRDRGPATFDFAMKMLLEDRILHDHGEGCLSLAYPGKLPSPLHTYFDTIRCLDMLVRELCSSEVVWFDAADYPLNIRFLTVSEELYDVTYMDERNWVGKAALLDIAWKKGLPYGQKDPFNHIAVVPNLDMAKQLRDYAFTQFAVVDHNGAVLGIYDNE